MAPMRLSSVLAAVVVAAAVALPAQATMVDMAIDWAEDAFEPPMPFDQAVPPPAPDYSDARAWSAYPGREDGADSVAEGTRRIPDSEAPADVFFVTPTSSVSAEQWNGPAVARRSGARGAGDGMLESMASAFNGCCRVFAPRYRHATFYAMIAPVPDSRKAIELAYSDVKRAFLRYLEQENHGRPFILASHSQGSWHAQRLIADVIDGDAGLRGRMIAAYTPGYLTPTDVFTRQLKHVALCAAPAQTGCLAVWNTFGADGDARFHRARVEHFYGDRYEAVGDKPTACVNPITWTADTAQSRRDDYLGVASFTMLAQAGLSLMEGALTAHCADGVLHIERYGIAHFVKAWTLPEDDGHFYDFSLFYLNIRANANLRTRAWLAARG